MLLRDGKVVHEAWPLLQAGGDLVRTFEMQQREHRWQISLLWALSQLLWYKACCDKDVKNVTKAL